LKKKKKNIPEDTSQASFVVIECYRGGGGGDGGDGGGLHVVYLVVNRH
jgi:hypothetical protein